jgi:hypothetical protein
MWLYLIKRFNIISKRERGSSKPKDKSRDPPNLVLTLIIILLAINTHAANLYRNYGYFIICISLFITLSSASPLSPPIKRGGGESL